MKAYLQTESPFTICVHKDRPLFPHIEINIEENKLERMMQIQHQFDVMQDELSELHRWWCNVKSSTI